MLLALRADLLYRRRKRRFARLGLWNRRFQCFVRQNRIDFRRLTASERYSCAPGAQSYIMSCFLLGRGAEFQTLRARFTAWEARNQPEE